ncbi:MAG: histidine phosphatase family protein [Pseudonocardiaceae bacterium]|nr:histidine phosphatase family protein [Pseudonocardiaceae bacterium]
MANTVAGQQETHTLIVLRHAHAGQGPGIPDAERELSERGIRDARRAASQLTPPDHVVCSTALRARQTWQQLSSELAAPAGPAVDYEPRIYSADTATLLDLVRGTGDEIGTLLLVGHNPTVHEFAHALLAEEAPASFPPASFAAIKLHGPWAELDQTRTRLAHSWTPPPA